MVTKADVFAYYRRISPFLLPYLRDRPVTLERLPDGVGPGKPRFWQKNTPMYYPGWIPRVAIPTERGKVDHCALVNVDRADRGVGSGSVQSADDLPPTGPAKRRSDGRLAGGSPAGPCRR
jgi:DNA primase